VKTYPIPMVPGPVKVHPAVIDAYHVNYGSSDLESEFLETYNQCEERLKNIMATQNSVVIQTGEGMLGLWGALKSCLKPGDRVLAIATGVFGDGIGDMAEMVGARVQKMLLGYNETISDIDRLENAIREFRPKMITAVHCETPSGTLNPLEDLGRLKHDLRVPLLYVDAVSSIGGTPVATDAWHIDLCLGGSQKCLSSLSDITFLSVSDAAWEVVEDVGYNGYDALKPFRTAQESHYFPYTPSWHGIVGLNAGADVILSEGLENCFARHDRVAAGCRNRLVKIGLSLFPLPDAVPSPTVTAVAVPEGITWAEFDNRLREQGLVVGGNYGPLAGNVFRLGHMGTQADPDLVEQALAVIERVTGKL